jgi:hypothetical protein
MRRKLVTNFDEQRGGHKLTHRLTIDSINAIIVTRTESDRLKEVDDRWPAIYIGRTLIASVFSGKCCTPSLCVPGRTTLPQWNRPIRVDRIDHSRNEITTKKGDSTISLGWGK